MGGPVSRDVAVAKYFCATPFDLVESTSGPAREGRIGEHGASTAVHRKASGRATVARTGSPRRQYQPALLLQDVQESDRHEFHRLSLKSPSREIEDALTQSQLAN